jgi:predicted MFS family arabinose efflux permease
MAERLGYLGLLRREPAFRRLWLGEVVSYLGDWFNTIALYTAVQSAAGTGQAVAGVMIAKTLPVFLIAPVSGPLVDRFDRRRLLLAMDLARAVGALGLIVAHQLGSLGGLYALTVAMILCAGIALPAKSAALPQIVPREHLAVANALSGGTWSIMLAVGAALGGGATELFGVSASFAIDAVSFLASAAFFVGLPALPPVARTRAQTSFIDGLRYLAREKYLCALVLLKPAMTLASAAIILIPFYGAGAFPEASGPSYVGLLWTFRGLGAVVGSLAVRAVFGDAPRTMRRLTILGFFLIGGAYGLLGEAETFASVCSAFFVAAIGNGLVWVFSGTLLQWEADEAYRGRLFALEFGLSTLSIAAASWAGGAALDAGYSPADVAFMSGVVVLPFGAAWAVLLLVVKQRLRRRARERLAHFYQIAAAEAALVARMRAGSEAGAP